MTFYKYTNTSTAELVLKNKSLRWSSPTIFNDLEECQFTPFTQEQYLKAIDIYKKILNQCASGCLLFDVDQFSEITQLLIASMKQLKKQGLSTPSLPNELLMSHESMHREYINKGLINCFRVLCVTTAYDNHLMWAHYADQHYGCVIELEKLYVNKPYLLKKGKVRYHENIEPLSNPLDMLLYGETKAVKELMVRDIIFSKRSNWEYEEEYRFMFSESFGSITSTLDMQNNNFKTTAEDQPDKLFTDVPISKDFVKSIIFGARTSIEEIDKILNVLSENEYHCQLYQMKMENGSLVKKPLSVLVE
ncbi:DUF2971 domain-containing protein [Photobacterium kagoshimensis]|uniref:DUF2971 domain-containing protein n=1 Tax=Photobacterium kagoshimensis TaxID=2910242 RepID=UPI003D0F7420